MNIQELFLLWQSGRGNGSGSRSEAKQPLVDVGQTSQVTAQFQRQSVGRQLLVGQGQPTLVLTGEVIALLGAEQIDEALGRLARQQHTDAARLDVAHREMHKRRYLDVLREGDGVVIGIDMYQW